MDLESTSLEWINGTRSNCDQLLRQFRQRYPVEQWKANGFFTEEDMYNINCHWLQFEPQKPYCHFSLAVFYVFIFSVGSVTNLTVIYVLIRTPANMLLINLAVSDLMLIVMIPMFIYNSFLQGPALGRIGCAAYGFLGGMSGTASIMTLSAIAVDRYLVLTQPLDVTRRPTYLRVSLTILAIWIYSVIFASLPFFGYGKYVPEGFLTSCSYDYLAEDRRTKIFILVFFLAAWVVPLAAISFCYAVIIRAVHHIRKDIIGRGDDDRTVHERSRNILIRGISQPDVEITIAKIVVGLVTLWTITWTPYALVSLIGISGYGYILRPFDSMVPALLAKTAACVDPFVYALNHPKIRNEIAYKILRHFVVQNRGESASDSMRFRDLKNSIHYSRHLQNFGRNSLHSPRSRLQVARNSSSTIGSRSNNQISGCDLAEINLEELSNPFNLISSREEQVGPCTGEPEVARKLVCLSVSRRSFQGAKVEMSSEQFSNRDLHPIQVYSQV